MARRGCGSRVPYTHALRCNMYYSCVGCCGADSASAHATANKMLQMACVSCNSSTHHFYTRVTGCAANVWTTPWRARLIPTPARMRLEWTSRIHLFLALRNTCLSSSLAARHNTLTAHVASVAHQLDGSRTCMHKHYHFSIWHIASRYTATKLARQLLVSLVRRPSPAAERSVLQTRSPRSSCGTAQLSIQLSPTRRRPPSPLQCV